MRPIRIAQFIAIFDASPTDASGCRIWAGSIQNGYGRYSGRWAHRIAHEHFIGAIPEGMTVDHTCFNTACVAPDHLRLLTNLENARNRKSRPHLVPDYMCVNGHEYTPENTYIRPPTKRQGVRDCRACIRARVAAYKARLAS